jgi:hypothetical protein
MTQIKNPTAPPPVDPALKAKVTFCVQGVIARNGANQREVGFQDDVGVRMRRVRGRFGDNRDVPPISRQSSKA